MTRTERRAEARADLVCQREGCGKPLDARRSTRKYCSDACRMVAYRARPPKGGPRPGQVRILDLLSKSEGYADRATIAEEAKVSPGHFAEYLGHVDPERWTDSSLLGLDYVTAEVRKVDGQIRWIYKITPAGREALARIRQRRDPAS